jgi:hypothetical protein
MISQCCCDEWLRHKMPGPPFRRPAATGCPSGRFRNLWVVVSRPGLLPGRRSGAPLPDLANGCIEISAYFPDIREEPVMPTPGSLESDKDSGAAAVWRPLAIGFGERLDRAHFT